MAESAHFIERVRSALDNWSTLEILTVVGRVTRQAGQTTPDIDSTQDAKILLTRVQLLQGDITTVFPPECLTDEYQMLRDFHRLCSRTSSAPKCPIRVAPCWTSRQRTGKS
ncbi:MAG: hypothetical protein FJZ47_21560 [Candidatus Tectomicrobia bacterium]|uniref:Uncharacterized protein n=1 Tax=Tectimicrobiota bacterium TaxID=2528274 RepID=A0A937W6I2_UNCTE|nr:hypothetical protein [Candidatus Tectomicrobia bacterium]